MAKNFGFMNLAIKDEKIYIAIKQKHLDLMRKNLESHISMYDIIEDLLKKGLKEEGYL